MTATEIVRVTCKAGAGADFAGVIGSAIDVILRNSECLRADVYRGIEDPDAFTMVIDWTSVDAHLRWRESEDMPEFRKHIADLLAKPNEMAHFELVEQRS